MSDETKGIITTVVGGVLIGTAIFTNQLIDKYKVLYKENLELKNELEISRRQLDHQKARYDELAENVKRMR